jgi:hypothetical protein
VGAVHEPDEVNISLTRKEGTGHVPALMYSRACSSVQIPGAAVVVGAVGFFIIKPPG